MTSLRTRLLFALLSTLLLLGVGASIATYLRARGEIDRLLDYQLRQHALSVRDHQYRGEVEALPGQDVVVQVWDRAGGRIYLSHRSRPLPFQRELGYLTIDDQGEKWRVYSLLMDGDLIQVGQPLSLRRQLAADAALRLLLPILGVIPIFGVLIWWIVGRSLRPLRDLTEALATRAPNALMPLQIETVPEEARPMIHALNDLLARLDASLSQLRDFTSDAAHELRTPLTAVKLQAQLLARAQSQADRVAASRTLQAGIDRAAQLVERMLTLARMEPEAMNEDFVDCDLRDAAQRVMDAEMPLAAARSVALTLTAGPPVVIRAGTEALTALIRNLVDNAIVYTPAGGAVRIDVERVGLAARLRVTDTGPGIPPGERQRVLQRFVRLSTAAPHPDDSTIGDADQARGSGLGLAIVQRAAQLHHATLELSDPEGHQGLCVTVTFPPATAAR